MSKNTKKTNTASSETKHSGNSVSTSVSIGKLRSIFRIFLKSVFALAIVIFLLIVLGLCVLLSSQSSREWLMQDLSPRVLSSSGIHLTIAGFNSPNIGYWYADIFALDIGERPIFSARKLLLNFDASTLLNGKIDVIELSAANLQISVPPSNNSSSESGINIKEMLIPLRIQKLALHNIDVTSSQFTLPSFQLKGQTALLWQKELFNSHLKLISNTQPDTFINLQANINKQFVGNVKAIAQEPKGGQLGEFLFLPPEQNVDIDLSLTVTPSNDQLNWKLEHFKLPWQTHKFNAHAEGHIDHQLTTLTLSGLNLFIDQNQQKLSGWFKENEFELEAALTSIPIDLANRFQDYIQGGELTGTIYASGPYSSPSMRTNISASTQYKGEPLLIDTQASGNLDTVNLERATINLGDAKLETNGEIHITQQAFDLKVQSLSGPVDIIETFDIPLPDDLLIDINKANGLIKGSFTSPNYSGYIDANGKYKHQKFKLRSDFEGDVEKIDLDNLHAQLSPGIVKAKGLINWQNQKLDLQLDTTKLPLSLAALFNIDLPKHLSADISTQGKLSGTFTKPAFDAQLFSAGQYREETFDLNMEAIGNLDQLSLENLSLNMAEGTMNASGSIDVKNNQSNLDINATNIPASLVKIAGLDLPEGLSARINTKGKLLGKLSFPYFNGKASATGAYQHTHFDIKTLLNGSHDKIDVESITASFKFDETKDSQVNNRPPNASIKGKGVFTHSSKNIEGELNVQHLPYEVFKLAGLETPKSLFGTINADVSISGKLPLPMIYGRIQSKGQLEGSDFNFDMTGSQEKQNFVFDQTKLSWNETVVTANGKASKEKLDLHVGIQELQFSDFKKFGYDLNPAKLDLEFNLLGSLESPDLNGSLELTLDNQDYYVDPETTIEDIVVTSRFMTENEQLTLTSHIDQGQQSKGHLTINSRYKALLNWLTDSESSLKITEIPIDISLDGNTGLSWFNNFIDRDIQNIAGKLTLDTQIDGTFSQPILNGSIALSDGTYLNALSQTSIENAEIELQFDEKSIRIIKAHANDAYQGTIKLNGGATLPNNDSGAINISLSLDEASLIRREDIEGNASGKITLSGDFEKMLLKGDVDVYPFQIMLDLIPTDSIPEIDVTLKENTNKKSKNNLAPPPVNLDINVAVDQQAYIRGRGLDAELKGKLALAGTIKKPRYDGRFQVIRGSFELFAKKFNLEEGDVLFSNDDVALFVQGRYEGKELAFIASLSGTIDDLTIALRTEPSLPEDEALSRLLFGKSIRNITPIQAIQLASAVQTLRGEGGTFDPLGKARDLLNVDNISVESQETSEGSGVAVGVGKYVTEDVYVEISRTPEPSQPWKGSIEVELAPNINLETTTGGSSGFGGVELQWKNDY